MFHDDGNQECRRCEAVIADGHRYCGAHYKEVLAEYEVALAQYHADSALWDQLSDEERDALNKEIERSSLRRYAMGLSFILSGVIYSSLELTSHQGIGIMIGGVVISAFVSPATLLLGRVARSLIKGSLYILIIGAIGASASLWVESLRTHSREAVGYGTLFCILFSVIAELRGRYHASAAPKEPTRPKP
jgi:hypothetical protein